MEPLLVGIASSGGAPGGGEVVESIYKATPWKINMEPENDGLEDDFPFQLGDF